jgi:hypothetical protein
LKNVICLSAEDEDEVDDEDEDEEVVLSLLFDKGVE